MEGSEIFVKLRPKKVVSDEVLAHSTRRRSVELISLCSFNLFGSSDSGDDCGNNLNDDDSEEAVVTEV